MQVDTSRDEAEKARAYLIRNVIVPLHPTCVPLPDLMGICTQVHNITAGLKAERDAATAERDRMKAALEKAAIAAEVESAGHAIAIIEAALTSAKEPSA